MVSWFKRSNREAGEPSARSSSRRYVEVEFPLNASAIDNGQIRVQDIEIPSGGVRELVEQQPPDKVVRAVMRAADLHAQDVARAVNWFRQLEPEAREAIEIGGRMAVDGHELTDFTDLSEVLAAHQETLQWLLNEITRLSDEESREQQVIKALEDERLRCEQRALHIYRQLRDGRLQERLAENGASGLVGGVEAREIQLGNRVLLQEQYRLGMDTDEGGPATELAIYCSRVRLDTNAQDRAIIVRHLIGEINSLTATVQAKEILLEQLRSESDRVRNEISQRTRAAQRSLDVLNQFVPGEILPEPQTVSPGATILAQIGLRRAGVVPPKGEAAS